MPTLFKTCARTLALVSLAGGVIATAACSQEPESTVETMPVFTTQEAPHLGALQFNSPMTLETIAAFFPSLKVTPAVGMMEGMEYPLIQVSTAAHALLFVIMANPEYPAEGMVEIKSAAIKLDNGAEIGQSLSEISATFVAADCIPGEEEHSGEIFCSLLASPTVSYVFAGTYNGPDGELPPKEVRQDFVLSSVRWIRN